MSSDRQPKYRQEIQQGLGLEVASLYIRFKHLNIVLGRLFTGGSSPWVQGAARIWLGVVSDRYFASERHCA
ncbi:uncharacterized protein N7482_005937 [Penicillium canariense]|uniref:Uncharacterized protein n=1 Tax=Penicillium canariense TaxID=189055 RepID=A0A9W9LNH4_9EURO|nr:uncharacterized protein N7482_005937 [Penicillium canariense]KAJ5167156.1 hypothetical protein N7482_005937 [Penicillium canariense]